MPLITFQQEEEEEATFLSVEKTATLLFHLPIKITDIDNTTRCFCFVSSSRTRIVSRETARIWRIPLLLKFLHLPVARGNVSKFFTSYPEKWRSVIKSFIAQNRVKTCRPSCPLPIHFASSRAWAEASLRNLFIPAMRPKFQYGCEIKKLSRRDRVVIDARITIFQLSVRNSPLKGYQLIYIYIYIFGRAWKRKRKRAASCVAVRLTICHDSGYPLFPHPPQTLICFRSVDTRRNGITSRGWFPWNFSDKRRWNLIIETLDSRV